MTRKIAARSMPFRQAFALLSLQFSLLRTREEIAFSRRSGRRGPCASPLRGRDCECGYVRSTRWLKQGPSALSARTKRSLCSANPAMRKRPLLAGDEEDALRHVAQADGPCRFARAFQNAWEWRAHDGGRMNRCRCRLGYRCLMDVGTSLPPGVCSCCYSVRKRGDVR